jgi:hypothetical protein
MKNKKTNGLHKLLSPWECPFIVAKVIGPSTYKLMTEDGIEVQKYVAYQPTKKILRLKNSWQNLCSKRATCNHDSRPIK